MQLALESGLMKEKRILLVDLENVPNLEQLDASLYREIVVLVGASQSSLRLPSKGTLNNVTLIRTQCGGKNCLDMHLALHLGRFMERTKGQPGVVLEILAKDKDYDPLVSHLRSFGASCRRIEGLPGAKPGKGKAKPKQQSQTKKKPVATSVAERPALVVLADSYSEPYKTLLLDLANDSARPATRESLTNYTYHRMKKLNIQTRKEASSIVRTLVKRGAVVFSETGKSAVYWGSNAK